MGVTHSANAVWSFVRIHFLAELIGDSIGADSFEALKLAYHVRYVDTCSHCCHGG